MTGSCSEITLLAGVRTKSRIVAKLRPCCYQMKARLITFCCRRHTSDRADAQAKTVVLSQGCHCHNVASLQGCYCHVFARLILSSCRRAAAVALLQA